MLRPAPRVARARRDSLRRAARRHPAWLCVVGYVLVAVTVFAPALRPGRTLVPADILTAVEPWHGEQPGVSVQNPIVSDAAFQFYPWWEFMARQLRAGHVPQWNPDLLGGTPFTPNGYVSAYYPPFWLPRVMATFDAYDLFLLLHLVLGACGICALARELGCRWSSAWLAGLGVFAGGMWVHWSFHLVHLVGMVWTPLVLAAALRVIDRPAPPRMAALGFAFGLWWLGANPQYAYYGSLAVGAIAAALVVILVAQRRPFGKVVIGLAAGFGFGALLAAPVLLPSASGSRDILRQREDVGAMTLTHIFGRDRMVAMIPESSGSPTDHVVVPGTDAFLDTPFIGVTGIVLAAGALTGRRRDRHTWILAGSAALLVVLGATSHLHTFLHEWLPGYDRFRTSSRWFAVFPVVMLPLAARGWDGIRSRDRRALAGTGMGIAVAAVVCLAWYFHRHHMVGFPVHYLRPRLLFTAAVLAGVAGAAVAAFRVPRVATAAVIAVSLAEVMVHTPRWYPSISKAHAFEPTAIARAARARGGRIVRLAPGHQPLPAYTPDVPLADGVADAQGQAVLFPKPIDRFLRLIDDYGNFATDQNTAPALTNPAQLASPLLDALDVRTVIAEGGVAVPLRYPLVQAGTPEVYARPSPGPAVLVPVADGVSRAEMWRRVADPAWDPTRTAAVVGLARPLRGGPGRVTRQRATTDSDRWRVVAPQGAMLRVSGVFAPGWHARLDGRPVPVLRADGIFRAVAVPAGRHTIEFRYRNAAEHRGRAIGSVALVALVALTVGRAVPVRRRARDRAPNSEPVSPS